MNRLPLEKRALILRLLCEGNSMRMCERTVGVSINTVTKLLVEVGGACIDFQNEAMVHLPCSRIQVDEIWSFCYSKAKHVPREKRGQPGFGDVWTWVAMCPDTKLVPCFYVGDRSTESGIAFLTDLRPRITNRFQLSADGHPAYMDAVWQVFRGQVDFGRVIKTFGVEDHGKSADKRYSPSKVIAVKRWEEYGDPDPAHISTSIVERQNLTLRMNNRRYTRLTNAHSKKLENHVYALGLFYQFYNFARPHQSLRGQTPAQAAGVDSHRWSFEEIAELAAQPVRETSN